MDGGPVETAGARRGIITRGRRHPRDYERHDPHTDAAVAERLRLPPFLRRNPRFTVVSVLILAVGIGACTAMFSIIHAVLLRPMALPNADRVVMLWSKDVRHDAVGEVTYEAEADYRARLRSFDEIALMNSVNWSGALIVPGR